jgi:hypothetical protein
MAQYNHYIVTEQRSLASAPETIELTLGVQPLTALTFQLEGQLATANTDDSLPTFASKISSIEVLWRGTRIAIGRPLDLIATYLAVTGIVPEFLAPGVTAGSIRQLNFAIPFTRKLFDPNEAFPASQKGDLVLIVRTAANPSAYNNYTLTVQATELPEARPNRFIRTSQLVATITSTGIFDLDLPRVLPILGINVAQTARRPYDANNTVTNFELLANNANAYLSSSRNESLEWLLAQPSQFALKTSTHRHTENTAGAYTQNATTLTDRLVNDFTDYQTYLNFDPLRDGSYAIDTSKLSDLKLRMNVTATATLYVNVVELATPDWLRLKMP